jgi:pimeloyl-ACP methyl ester carboxylesterase
MFRVLIFILFLAIIILYAIISRCYFRNNIEYIGYEDEPVIFFNGLKDTKECWDNIVTQLPGILTLQFDFPQLPIPANTDLLVDYIYENIKQSELPAPYKIVAHSASYIPALIFLSRYPDLVSKIILIDPTPLFIFERLANKPLPIDAPDIDISEKIARSYIHIFIETYKIYDWKLANNPKIIAVIDLKQKRDKDKYKEAQKTYRNIIQTKGFGHYIHKENPKLIADIILKN